MSSTSEYTSDNLDAADCNAVELTPCTFLVHNVRVIVVGFELRKRARLAALKLHKRPARFRRDEVAPVACRSVD
jgi:hypothetical protein